MKYTFVGNWYLKKINIWVLKNNWMKIDYKKLESMCWMKASSNIFCLIYKNFLLRSVCLVVLYLKKKFGVAVAGGVCLHILNRTKRERQH